MDDETEQVDGPKIAAEILKQLSPSLREKLVKGISLKNPESAQKINNKLNSLNTILETPSLILETALRKSTDNDIVLALKTAEPEVQSHILSHVSENRRLELLEKFERMPPVKLADVTNAQKLLLNKVETPPSMFKAIG
jgi:flagellar motor switch protein FliG